MIWYIYMIYIYIWYIYIWYIYDIYDIYIWYIWYIYDIYIYIWYIYMIYIYIIYIYIYMWQGPFGIMRPSSLSPHIVLLFFLWLLSLSLFLFLFLFFFSLSLSLALFLAVLFSACIFGHTILFVSHLCPYLSPLFSPICILNSLTIAILLISSLRLLSVLVS